jgi:hypothetical protein
MNLDMENKANRAKITGMLKVWKAAGSLVVVDGMDEHREVRKFVEVRKEE